MVSARYAVGIDLGTSHTLLAWADLQAQQPEPQLFDIAQAVASGQVADLPLLPSLRYHPVSGELPAAELDLPWPQPRLAGDVLLPAAVFGRRARDLGAQLPGRLVASAKSWLSHPGVDRHAAILPWGAPAEVERISPLAASASYLAQLRAAWDRVHPDHPLAQQDVTLTVPASFDEGARALTLEAARLAGLERLRLVEEPQAALHDWLFHHRERLAAELKDSRLVLVVDVGGGTTDLTLVRVEPDPAGGLPQLTRIAVGDHLMLGGDNMDFALAHLAERRLAGDAPLPAAQLSQLVQRCRAAKELLLSGQAPQSAAVTLLGGGSRLIGAARSVELGRDEVERLVLDGFLPLESASARPRRRRSGIVEFGLPYPADAAITRHLADFLQRHADAARVALGPAASDCEGGFPLPDTLLLNGGVFRSVAITRRITALLESWRGRPLRVLHNVDPDLAVARGAVVQALLRAGRLAGLGAGVGGGAARSYFLLLQQGGREQGLCVLPRGTPECQPVELSNRRFALRLGQAVRFHLASTSSDQHWLAGELAEVDGADFVRLPPLAALLPPPQGQRRAEVEVGLVATMTELGTLEVQAVACDDPQRRWRLAFDLRAGDAASASRDETGGTVVHPRLDQAIALIDRVFGEGAQRVEPREVSQLRGGLERLLGAREDWDLALSRALFDALLARARRRRRSAAHERAWLNLAGYCLRPGAGAPLDDWRVAQLWQLYPQGLQFGAESNNWSEWWTLWRRAAGGLDEAAQIELLQQVGGHLEQIVTSRQASHPLRGSHGDMLRLVAALERVPPAYRAEVGDWLVARLCRLADIERNAAKGAGKGADKGVEKAGDWWVVGRLGARVSLHGQAQNVVPPEVAQAWLDALLALDWRRVEQAAFAAVQIARLSGDRVRDLAPAAREQVLRRLAEIGAPPAWSRMLRERVELEAAEQRLSYGEALPPGLRLLKG
jgi:molecular chaperone DnaK (HSP70)